MPGHDIIVLGTSGGGVEALCRLVGHLPPGLPAALFVVCHFPAGHRSRLPEILSRSGPLLATHAQDGEPIRPGQIYVAPPDFHLTLSPGHMHLGHGARENHHRPAIDPLFRSAARAYGRRVVGVILTGGLHDGVAGLLAIRSAGGVSIVQDPEEAAVADMPRNASAIAGADYLLPLAEIPDALARLVREPIGAEGVPTMADPIEHMPDRITRDMAAQQDGARRGKLTVLTCPECGGAMWQVDEHALTRFRCHVGHAYYGEGLLAEQSAILEAALWTAVRTFKEKTILARQLAAQALAQGDTSAAERFRDEADVAGRYGRLIQENLLGAPSGPDREPEEGLAPVEPPPGPGSGAAADSG
jgi:two-component system chemotaxis response regulator CheB